MSKAERKRKVNGKVIKQEKMREKNNINRIRFVEDTQRLINK